MLQYLLIQHQSENARKRFDQYSTILKYMYATPSQSELVGVYKVRWSRVIRQSLPDRNNFEILRIE